MVIINKTTIIIYFFKTRMFDTAEDQHVPILDQEDRRFEEIKEAFYIKHEKINLDTEKGLRFQLSKTYSAALSSIPNQ